MSYRHGLDRGGLSCVPLAVKTNASPRDLSYFDKGWNGGDSGKNNRVVILDNAYNDLKDPTSSLVAIKAAFPDFEWHHLEELAKERYGLTAVDIVARRVDWSDDLLSNDGKLAGMLNVTKNF